jgi:dipeptidyl aminopeptidase/acylaminoacyl peptidase
MPGLIVSEALIPTLVDVPQGAKSGAAVTLVSLPPGTLSHAVSVEIRNLTTGGAPVGPVPIVDGGFDPVGVPARVGDRIELSFLDESGGVQVEQATVPAKKPPVVVRLAPPKGRTDVALSVKPVVVFSEPIDPATVTIGMRLVTGGVLVSGRTDLLASQPWIAQFLPSSPLAPSTRYQLEVTQEVRGVDGGSLASPVSADFTTEAPAPPEPPPPEPPASPAGLLALSYNCDIYVMHWSGEGTRQLTSNDRHTADDPCDFNPEWSPDGTRIAFSRYGGGFIHEIHVINADGTGLHRVSPQGVQDFHPTWSPDGSRLAFEHRVDNVSNGDLYIMNADGTDRVRVTNDPEPDEYPVWSPKGDRIAFMSYDDGDGSDIFVVNLDGTNRVNLTRDGAWDVDVAWSPDGERLVAARDGELLLLNPDGTQRAQLTQGVFAAHAPAWSPDGATIAFNRNYPCTGTIEIPICPAERGLWTVRVSDGRLERLPLLGGGDASWHP